jgi:hypothetical protein
VLASLVLLPFIAAGFGPGAALAIGQSIGGFLSVVIGMAWPVIGGNAVARAPSLDAQRELFRNSLYSRMLVVIAVCASGMPLALMFVDEYPGSTVLFMLATSANGLTALLVFRGYRRTTASGDQRGPGTIRRSRFSAGGISRRGAAGLVRGVQRSSGCDLRPAQLANGFVELADFWVTGAHRLALQIVREQLGGTLSRL